MKSQELHSVLIPAENKASRKLMLVLHGLGDSLEGFRFLPHALQLADLNYLLVNAPDHYFGGYSWYSYPHSASSGPEIARSRELLFKLLDQQREAGFESGNTFLFGFSQGCLMTLEAGLRYPHKLGGCIGVSGYAHDADQLIKEQSPVAKEQRFLLTHGSLDDVVPHDRTERQVSRLRAAGIQIQWKVFAKPHTIIDAEFPLFREFVIAQ
ncbi:MAG: serine esterase [Verrucomicrobiae bacterium]|nr:serine esterase [Verrucomicrobiae bacterium]